MLNYRKNLTVRLDIEALTFSPRQTYALTKEFGDRFQLLYTIEKAPDEIISLGRKLDFPQTLMDRLIHKKLNNKGLFLIILHAIEQCEKADLNMQYQDGSSFLHQAVHANNITVYKWLLEAGVNSNLKNNQGRTALELAKELKREEFFS